MTKSCFTNKMKLFLSKILFHLLSMISKHNKSITCMMGALCALFGLYKKQPLSIVNFWWICSRKRFKEKIMQTCKRSESKICAFWHTAFFRLEFKSTELLITSSARLWNNGKNLLLWALFHWVFYVKLFQSRSIANMHW